MLAMGVVVVAPRQRDAQGFQLLAHGSPSRFFGDRIGFSKEISHGDANNSLLPTLLLEIVDLFEEALGPFISRPAEEGYEDFAARIPEGRLPLRRPHRAEVEVGLGRLAAEVVEPV